MSNLARAHWTHLTALMAAVALTGCSLVTGFDRDRLDGSMQAQDGGPDAGRDGGTDGGPVDAGCTTDEACDDEDACTVDTCDMGGCVHEPVDPNDDDVCTEDACDPATGVTNTAIEGCCRSNDECDTGVCMDDVCRPATCTDGVQNGTETDTDCGGDCHACALGQMCMAGTDCDSGHCVGGVCVECEAATDCPGDDTECQARTCESNACGVSFTAAGTALSTQTAGDCRRQECDGSGGITDAVLDTDLPDDMNPCTDDVCTAGTPSNPPLTAGTSCSAGDSVCDGAGNCVGCITADDCPGTDTECRTRTCVANVCGVSFTATGTPVASQTEGDCRRNECDGAGEIVSRVADTDVPVDGNQCTDDVCTAGTPSNPPSTARTTCDQSGGSLCNGTGACVSCVEASDCPGSDTECQVRVCNAGTCEVNNTAAGTPIASQTAGDCQESQCDGSGAVVSVNDDADVPVDANPCTDDVCTAGTPSNPPLTAGTSCSAGDSVCDGAGNCVGCITADDCPGTDTECRTRTCVANVCGVSFTATGTPVASQTEGDCRRNECDGAGEIVSRVADTDVPVDGNQCTDDVCTAGTPSNPPSTARTTCDQSGGSLCNGAGACVACVEASDCPGSDTECQVRVCNSGFCDVSNTPLDTPTSMQTPGDCQLNVCDGMGGVTTVNADTDVLVDGNECTDDVCVGGVPANPPRTGAACSTGGGAVCDASGGCVECNVPSDCGSDTECLTRTCTAGTCGTNPTAGGTPLAAQTPGDCQRAECDGSGGTTTVADDVDLPDDGNECTENVCTAGAPSHPPLADGTACSQDGGTVCSAGTCVSQPTVTATSPADGSSAEASTTVGVTFSEAMDASSLFAQTSAGACSGTVQVSLDDFATCIAMAAAAPTMSGSDTIATFTPEPGLLVNRTYEVRVTTDVRSALGGPMAASYESTMGFVTGSPQICGTSVVIAEVYGGGGNATAVYTHDYVVLHNRGLTTADLTGWSLQYAGASGSTWSNRVDLAGSIAPGGYFLVQLASGGSSGVALPAPDQTGSINMGSSSGKLALVSTTTALSGTCPTDASIVDFVGFGSSANCFEGSAPVAAPSNATSISRRFDACQDTDSNSADFTVVAPSPRTSASTPVFCGCANNESDVAGEADFCNVQFPSTLSVAVSGTSAIVYGRIFEAGVTEAGGADASVVAQLGYGPATANPQ